MLIPVVEYDKWSLMREMEARVDHRDDPFAPGGTGLYKPLVGEAVLQEMLLIVQTKVLHPIYPLNSYARNVYRGTELKEHTDRPGIDWTVTINVARDHAWELEVEEGAGWVGYDSEEKGILIPSGVFPHKRGPYQGDRAYQLFLHYTANLRRQGDARPQEIRYAKPNDALYISASKVLSKKDIARIYKDFDANELAPGMVSHNGVPSENRANSIAWLRRPAWGWLYDRMKTVAHEINRANWHLDIYGVSVDEVQFTRYEVGERYGWHADTSDTAEGQTAKRTLSVVIPIKEADEGGGLEIRDAGIVRMNEGDATLFPATVEHRALEVLRGRRDSLILWLSRG